MKVSFFVREFPVYSETFITDQITGLIDRGFDVNIITLKKNTHSEIQPVIDYNLMDKVIELPCDYGLGMTATIKSLLSIVKSFPNKTFRHYLHDGIKRKKRGAEELAAILQTKTTITSDKIIAHFGPNAVMAMKLSKMGVLSGKVYGVFHGYDMSRISYLDKYLVDYKELFKTDMMALPVSEFWQDKLMEFGCPKEKITVNRMGVDIKQFSFKPKLIRSPLRILSVARHTEKKGLEYAIKAMALLKKEGIDFAYNIAGTGPLMEKHQNLIDELDLSDNVKLLGMKNHQEVNTLLEDSDVFVLPSVTPEDGDKEGIPVSLMEAMAKGVICLSTLHSGIPELIKHEESGFLVEEKNPEQIARVLQEIMEKDLSQYYIKGRSKIANDFNQQKEYDKLAKLLAL